MHPIQLFIFRCCKWCLCSQLDSTFRLCINFLLLLLLFVCCCHRWYFPRECCSCCSCCFCGLYASLRRGNFFSVWVSEYFRLMNASFMSYWMSHAMMIGCVWFVLNLISFAREKRKERERKRAKYTFIWITKRHVLCCHPICKNG